MVFSTLIKTVSNMELKEVSRLLFSTYMYYIIMPTYWAGYVVLNVILKRCTSLKRDINTSLHCQQCSYSAPCFLGCICRYLSYLIKICKDGRRNKNSRNGETCGGCICSQLSDTWNMIGNTPVMIQPNCWRTTVGTGSQTHCVSFYCSLHALLFFLNSNSEGSIKWVFEEGVIFMIFKNCWRVPGRPCGGR